MQICSNNVSLDWQYEMWTCENVTYSCFDIAMGKRL